MRSKKVKSDRYLYLVKSVWDSKNATSRQEIVKYLGKASDVMKEDIPEEYRNDPKMLSVLASFSPNTIKKREDATKRFRQDLYKKLTDGNIRDCISLYKKFVQTFSTGGFFDRILKPVMHKIGDDWASGKISIATEHVASNVAQTLVKIIMENVSGTKNKKKILLCVPLGEEHHLGCDVLETYLSIKGFKVYNMGVSVPTQDILGFVDSNNPDFILVSITLEDNLTAGKRLVSKIRSMKDVPVLVGGMALLAEKIPKFDGKVISEMSLEELPKILRNAKK